MRVLGLVIAAAALLTAGGSAVAGEGAPAAYGSCVACHGAAGEGNSALNSPALAGQQAAYLERQLKHFRSGVRGSDPADTLGGQMKGMAMTLAEADIPVLAQWLASQPMPVVATPAQGDLKNGNNYYQSKCGACHGGRAEGNAGLNAPALVGLDAAYIKRQYNNFQKGLRGEHAEDKYGRQMKMMSTSLPGDKDLDDVIAFIHTLAAAQ